MKACIKSSYLYYELLQHVFIGPSGVNLGGGAQAPSGLAIAPPRFIPKALRNGKV